MMELFNRPALVFMIQRVQRSKYIKEINVANTTNKKDDAIVNCISSLESVKVTRGSEEM